MKPSSAKQKRICMVVAAVPPSHSGIGAQAMLLARQMRTLGELPVVLAHRGQAPTGNGADLVRRCGWGYPRGGRAVLFAIEAGLWLVRHRGEVRVVHLHGGGVGPISVGAVAHVLGLPVVYKVSRLGDDDPASAAARGGGKLRRWVITRARRVIAISPAIRDACLEAGVDPARLVEVPNGVDLERFSPLTPNGRVEARRLLGIPLTGLVSVYVGAVEARKRTTELVRLWTSVAEPDDTLWLVGPVVDPTGSTDPRVRAPGSVVDPSPYLRSADLFLFLSSAEGLPNALLEAQAAGLPAIVSPLRGVHDYVVTTGQNGVVLEDLSAEAFAEAWSCIRSPIVRDALAAGAGVNAKRFDIRAVARAYLRVYEECCHE